MPDRMDVALDDFDFREALSAWEIVTRANKYVDDEAVRSASEDGRDRCRCPAGCGAGRSDQTIRVVAVVVNPFIPAAPSGSRPGWVSAERWWRSCQSHRNDSLVGRELPKAAPIFPGSRRRNEGLISASFALRQCEAR